MIASLSFCQHEKNSCLNIWKYHIKHVSLRPLFDDESIITTNQMFCHLHTHFAFIRHILVVIIGDNPEFTSAVAEAFYIGQHPGQT